jgi:hypothetical protein
MTNDRNQQFIAAMMTHPKGREIMLRSMASIIQDKLDIWRAGRNKAVALSPSETLANRDRVFPDAFNYEIELPLEAIDEGEQIITREFLRDGETRLKWNEIDLQAKIFGLVPLPLVIVPAENEADRKFGFLMRQQYARMV